MLGLLFIGPLWFCTHREEALPTWRCVEQPAYDSALNTRRPRGCATRCASVAPQPPLRDEPLRIMLGTVPFVSSRHSQMIYFLAVASVLAQKGAVLELTGDAPTIHFGELGGADVLTLVHNSTEDELVCSGKIRASDVVIESTSTTVADLIGEVATLRQDMAAVKQIGARDLQKPWAASTVVLGKYGSIGTQGSYRTSLTWNYGRDRHATPSPTYSTLGITRWDDGHTFTQAGAVEIGSSGLLFRYQNAFGTNESDGPLNRMTLNEDSLSLAAGTQLGVGAASPDEGLHLYRSGSTHTRR